MDEVQGLTSHGLTESDWKNTLAQDPCDPLQLSVKVTDGTFLEFVAVTNVPQQTFTPTSGGGVHVHTSPPLGAPRVEDVILLDDVLARSPALFPSYVAIAQRPAKHQPGMIIAERNNYEVYIFHLPVPSSEAESVIRRDFQIPETVPLGFGPFISDTISISSYVYRVSLDDSPRPAFERDGDKSGNLIQPMTNGAYLNPLVRCYLASYFLGMLVRYFPAKWMGMIRNQRGDATVPLLRATLDHIEMEFPALILRALNAD